MPAKRPKQLSFQSKLERLAPGIEYYALLVPAKITQALGTKGPVAVSARVNGSSAFLVSLHPIGGGRHKLRVKASVRDEVKLKGGDRVRVQITVLGSEIAIPRDLEAALRADGVLKDFQAIPPGERRFTIRVIDQAAKPETRAKRIRDAVELAHRKREKA